MDTLEDIDKLKPYSVKRTDTKALFDDEPEDAFFRLLDALSIKATSWFSFQENRPQLDETALCCLGLLVEEFIRYQQTPLIDVMHKNLNIPALKQLLTPEEFQSGSLPVLIEKHKKKHEFIQEGHVKQRPNFLQDLRQSYQESSRLQKYQEEISNNVDEQLNSNNNKKKKKEKGKGKKIKKNTELKDISNEEEEEEEESNNVDVKIEPYDEPESSLSSSMPPLPESSSSQPSKKTKKSCKYENKIIKKRKASEFDLFDTINKSPKENGMKNRKKKKKVLNKSKSKSKKPSFF